MQGAGEGPWQAPGLLDHRAEPDFAACPVNRIELWPNDKSISTESVHTFLVSLASVNWPRRSVVEIPDSLEVGERVRQFSRREKVQ